MSDQQADDERGSEVEDYTGEVPRPPTSDAPGPARRPSEVGSPWRFGGRPWFTDAGHQGHLHVGFSGPTQPGETR